MRVVVSGGGTAGHILPTLATSDALRSLDKDVELLYVGQAGGMEAKIVAGSGLNFAPITAGKFRRNHFDSGLNKLFNVRTLGPNARDSLRTVQGVGQAMRILRSFKPDVVFLKGGYVCLPVGIAAKLLGIPFVIHESDVVPGLTNRILSRWAERVAVGFPVKSYRHFEAARLVYTGNPTRRDILEADKAEGMEHFELEAGRPVVLVTGGSQGAAQINNAVLGALPQLLEKYQVIHLTGEGEIGRIRFELRGRKKEKNLEYYHPYGFLLGDMGLALAVADVVVGRAGVNTINDCAALGKPVILVPNFEMAGHQVENARVLSRQGAARVLDGESLTPAGLAGEITKVIDDEEEQQRLAEAIKKFYRPESATELAQLITSVAGVQKPNTKDAEGEDE